MSSSIHVSDPISGHFGTDASPYGKAAELTMIRSLLKSPMTVFPRVNVYEHGDLFVLTTYIPGLDFDALQVVVKANEVVIRGQRKPDAETADALVILRERAMGEFRRSIRLPDPVLYDEKELQYRNGALIMRFRKNQSNTALSRPDLATRANGGGL